MFHLSDAYQVKRPSAAHDVKNGVICVKVYVESACDDIPGMLGRKRDKPPKPEFSGRALAATALLRWGLCNFYQLVRKLILIYRLIKPAALCCVVAALAGCAATPAPLAENFPITSQKKVRSAGHWNLLTHDVIEQTVAALGKAGATPQTTLFVPLAADSSQFERALHQFLITDLVQKGWHVLPNGNAMLTLNYQSQIVKHKSERPFGGPTPIELILTTTVSNPGGYISRKTDVYYVEESDTSLFHGLNRDPSVIYAKNMKVVGE